MYICIGLFQKIINSLTKDSEHFGGKETKIAEKLPVEKDTNNLKSYFRQKIQ